MQIQISWLLHKANWSGSTLLQKQDWLIELGFNDTSTLVGHFVSSPREREKKDRRDSRGDEREGQGRKRNRNESEETEEIKTSPSTLTCYKDSRPCPAVSQYSWAPRWRKIKDTFAPPNHPQKAGLLLLTKACVSPFFSFDIHIAKRELILGFSLIT